MLAFISITAVLPFLHVLAQSFSDNVAIDKGDVYLWPVRFTAESYNLIFHDPTVWSSMRNSVVITIGGTFINLAATATLAYALSRQEYRFRKVVLMMVLITLIFQAPLIPNYLLIRNLHLLNTLWALMLPNAISAFNLFVMRSFFMGLPGELIDSGRIDGCGELRMLWSIVLPLSKPVMATMGLIYGVNNWNTFKDAIYYITKNNLIPIQVKLQQMVVDNTLGNSDINSEMAKLLSPEGIKMAVIIVATIPIMMAYPFLQKYFVKGMMVGSIKS
nr:carbohydrate ABC transporter permease [Cohnella zeiphila]